MRHAVRRWTLAVSGALLLVGSAAADAGAVPVTVNLRVEGSSTTIFEGPVTTDGHAIAKDASGSHPCDGTNGGANPAPGPTMTASLDDASLTGAFTWAGTWFASFQDFGIDRVGPDASDSTHFWGYSLDYKPVSVGGCQQQVVAGDEVIYGYDFFSKAHLLRLTGPAKAEADQPVSITVTDGQDGSPIAGATVGGQLTGADGKATVTFDSTGDHRLKAERADSLRSNALVVCVHRGADGNCGTTAPAPPGAAPAPPAPAQPSAPAPAIAPQPRIAGISTGRLFAPGHGPRLLRGTVTLGGDGLRTVRFRLLRRHRGRCQYYSAVSERLRATSCRAPSNGYFYALGSSPRWSYLLPSRLPAGSYALQVRAIDRSGRRGERGVVFAVTERRRFPRDVRSAAAGPRVEVMVAGRTRVLGGPRFVRASARRLAVGRRRCTVAAGTPLAALAALRRAGGPSFVLRDYGSCGRAADGGSLYVPRIGGERERGRGGWVYKRGARVLSIGGGDPQARARAGQRVLWFWCRQSGRCQRTLAVSAPARAAPGAALTVTVRGYDDQGRAVRVAGALVRLAGTSVRTGPGGTAVIAAPAQAGSYQVSATRAGLVPAFPEAVRVG
jgi:hypothetical protein